jgi:hypothetical protein
MSIYKFDSKFISRKSAVLTGSSVLYLQQRHIESVAYVVLKRIFQNLCNSNEEILIKTEHGSRIVESVGCWWLKILDYLLSTWLRNEQEELAAACRASQCAGSSAAVVYGIFLHSRSHLRFQRSRSGRDAIRCLGADLLAVNTKNLRLAGALAEVTHCDVMWCDVATS